MGARRNVLGALCGNLDTGDQPGYFEDGSFALDVEILERYDAQWLLQSVRDPGWPLERRRLVALKMSGGRGRCLSIEL